MRNPKKKAKRTIRLRRYQIQLKNEQWVKVREVTLEKKSRLSIFGTALGSYDPKKHLIEILPPRLMYQVVLDHEARHAASPIMSVLRGLLNWKILAFIQLGTGLALIYSAAFGHAWTPGQQTFTFGLTIGLAVIMIMANLEEFRNRYVDWKQVKELGG